MNLETRFRGNRLIAYWATAVLISPYFQEFFASVSAVQHLDGSRKFRDFFFSALAVQRLSDLICLEHQLSVIEKKPYRERLKRIVYPPKESNRDHLCGIIDTILAEKSGDYEAFLQKLEQQATR